MEFRKAVKTDVNCIMKIIEQAQAYFKEREIDQWQDGYPGVDTINRDIAGENSYVLLDDNKIVAAAAVSFDGETTYETIYEGQWLSHHEYAVIHRLAVDNNHKGLGLSTEVIKRVERLCLNKGVHSIKVDTHEENIPMQKLLEKNKFQYCGIIYLENRSKRIAFEKVLGY